MKRILLNGAIAGFLGGLALAAYMLVIGRGPINDALRYEEEVAHATEGSGHAHDALFSQGAQEVGGAIGLLLFGVALGLIFAITLASMMPKLRASTPLGASVRLGMIGFWVAVVVPFLKYPANPPAIGDPDTINSRTINYFAVLALSIVLANGVWNFVQRVERPPVTRAWLGASLYGLGLILIFVALPDAAGTGDAPGDLIWNFRLASLGGLAACWTVLALAMGSLLTAQRRATTEAQPTLAAAL